MNKSVSWLAVAVSAEAQAMEAIANFLFENGSLGIEEKEGLIEVSAKNIFGEKKEINKDRLYLKKLKVRRLRKQRHIAP